MCAGDSGTLFDRTEINVGDEIAFIKDRIHRCLKFFFHDSEVVSQQMHHVFSELFGGVLSV